MTHEGARDLLDRTHLFPGSYTIKAIGAAVDDFVGRTVGTARGVLQRTADVRYTVRSTPDGNHVSVTLDLEVVSAEEVIQVYQALQVVKGMRFLL